MPAPNDYLKWERHEPHYAPTYSPPSCMVLHHCHDHIYATITVLTFLSGYHGSNRQALCAMSEAAPNTEPAREGFTCSALLMCLYLPGLSKKKPEETIRTSPPTGKKAPAPDHPAEQQEAPYAPSRAASLDKSECASLYSRNNIVFDFVVEEGDQAPAQAVYGYCPSPCFDLPLELIRAGERFGAVAADSDAPVRTAFVFDDGQRGAGLKKMASCLVPGVDSKNEPRPPHLLRFLSASGRSSVMPSHVAPQGKAVDGDCELGELAMVPACNE